MENLPRLYIEDNGNGNIVIKLNGMDVTNGMQKYEIERDFDNFVKVRFEMMVIPEKINIEKKNSKSSIN